MSPETMNYIYYVCLFIFGYVMYSSPQAFMGKAKNDEGAVKAQELLQKIGIAIMVMFALATLYQIIFK